MPRIAIYVMAAFILTLMVTNFFTGCPHEFYAVAISKRDYGDGTFDVTVKTCDTQESITVNVTSHLFERITQQRRLVLLSRRHVKQRVEYHLMTKHLQIGGCQ